MNTNTYELMRKLMSSINKIDGAYYVYGRSEKINENTLALLYELDDDKPHTQKQISDDWLIPRTTVNTIVKDLASKNYLTLTSEPHSKEKKINLTKEGKAYTKDALKDIYEAEQKAIKATLEKFSPEFIEAFDFLAGQICTELTNIRQK